MHDGGRTFYEVQQVCENGHQINTASRSATAHNRAFCPTCGAKTLTACAKCNEPIPGTLISPNIYGPLGVAVPDHCGKCGAPFPWQGKIEGPTVAQRREYVLFRVLERFHGFARQLRARHDDRATLDVTDEYDVQDALHAILRIFFDDVRPEEWTPSYAGKSARMDFLLKNERVVVEVKHTRKGLGTAKVGDELLVDIARYRKHPECKFLVCFVYDPDGHIKNPKGLEADLSHPHDELEVKVFVWPKA